MYTLIAILLVCTELSSFYFGSLHAGETYELLLLLIELLWTLSFLSC